MCYVRVQHVVLPKTQKSREYDKAGLCGTRDGGVSVKDEEWMSGPGRVPSGKTWLVMVPRTLCRIVTVLPVSYILIFYFLFVVLGIELMDPGV